MGREKNGVFGLEDISTWIGGHSQLWNMEIEIIAWNQKHMVLLLISQQYVYNLLELS